MGYSSHQSLGLTNSGVTSAFQAEVVLKKTKGSSNKNLCETHRQEA